MNQVTLFLLQIIYKMSDSPSPEAFIKSSIYKSVTFFNDISR